MNFDIFAVSRQWAMTNACQCVHVDFCMLPLNVIFSMSGSLTRSVFALLLQEMNNGIARKCIDHNIASFNIEIYVCMDVANIWSVS